MKRFGNENANHVFDVEVSKYDAQLGGYAISCVEVIADDRAQAKATMNKKGFHVISVKYVKQNVKS